MIILSRNTLKNINVLLKWNIALTDIKLLYLGIGVEQLCWREMQIIAFFHEGNLLKLLHLMKFILLQCSKCTSINNGNK